MHTRIDPPMLEDICPVEKKTEVERTGRVDPDIAWDVWVTKEQEVLKCERLLRNLLLLRNPDTKNFVWATSSCHHCFAFRLSCKNDGKPRNAV